ncbi:MAG: GNAT family N-acetyltransferase [Candidatus Shapirobacteria bacterium]
MENIFEVGLGYLEKYKILYGQNKVGRMSLVKFQVNEPFRLDWAFLNEIYVEPKYRQKGIAKNVLFSIDDELRENIQNGILINAITINGAKTLYDQLGWKRIRLDHNWEILKNIEVSDFIVNRTRDLVSKNLIKWQAVV